MLQVIEPPPQHERKHLDKPSFFLASPGDLAGEREALCLRLQDDLKPQGYDVYAYEYDPDLSFQAGIPAQGHIPYPSDPNAHVTICLLGERLGSGVGDSFKLSDGFAEWLAEWQKPLGSPIALPGERLGRGGRMIPLTGTLFELLDALRTAGQGRGREVWVFVKGTPDTLRKEPWSANPSLAKVDLVRNFGLNAFHRRLIEVATTPSPGTVEAQEYLDKRHDEQLSYVDAVLRILYEQGRMVQTFAGTQDLMAQVRQKARTYFGDRTPMGGTPWQPSLEPIGAQHQSLFGRTGDVLSICDGLIRLSRPEEAGRPWYVLHGVSGSGKSSVARGGVAARFRRGYRNLEVTALETSPRDLLRDATRPPVLELARRIRSDLGNPQFPTRDEQDRWDRCIDLREEADAGEVAGLVVSLVRAASGEKQRHVLVVMDQAEEWWDGNGKFMDASRPMLIFLDHLTRSKAAWCLTVLQSEPTGRERGTDPRFGGRLGSLTQLGEFKGACAAGDVEIHGPLPPPDSRGKIREIVHGVVGEQIGVVPEGLDALVDAIDEPRERNVPFLPLLGLRLKRICEDLRAQVPAATSARPRRGRTGAPHHDTADDPFRDAATEGPHLTVAPWMTEDILGELDALGEVAIADIAALVPDADALDAALDLCLTTLLDVAEAPPDDGAEGPPRRSDQCRPRDATPAAFGAPDAPERLLYDTLLRHRLIRFAGAKEVRLAHKSIVDHWGRAQQWFDRTASRRNAMKRVAGMVAEGNTVAAIAANLESADNLNAVREVLHHVASRSPLVPAEIGDRRGELIDGFTAAFEAQRDAPRRNERLDLALDAGFDELIDRLLAPPGTMAALDADAGAPGTEPLLVRLARAGRLDLVVRGAKEGCRRTAMSPLTGDSVFSVLLHRAEHDEEGALATIGVLLDGDESDRVDGRLRPRPLNGAERAEILAARTEQGQRSLLDLAARSGSPKAIRFALHLATDEEARRRLIDPLSDYTTRGFEMPLFLAVASGKVAGAREILEQARRLLGKAGLRRYVNAMPVRSGAGRRREPPILAAASNGDAGMVRLLLEHGADPTRAASDLSDAFQAALLNDDTEVLDVLLASSFRPPASGVGFSLGHWAAVLNAHACLLRLTKVGKKKSWPRDAIGRTPLHVACARSQPDVLKALLDSLPEGERARRLGELDDRRRNGLTTALSAGRVDIAEHLLEIPGVAVTVNKPNPEGYRPLHYAVRFCGVEGIALLRAKGAETDFDVEGDVQLTPLQIAAMVDDADACEMLLTERSLAQRNPHERTALHYAARHGSAQALAKLLAAPDAPVRARNAEGQTALHLAAFFGHEACVAQLLEKDAGKDFMDAEDDRPEGKAGGRTALWSAASAGHAGIVRLLAARGADIERMSANHLRPIDEACRRGRAEAVRALLEAGARTEAARLDLTPLHYACRGGHGACFDVLAAWLEEREGPNALGRALAARTQFGDTPLQMLGKALIRATRPAHLARPLAGQGDLEPDDEDEDEIAEREDTAEEEPVDERQWAEAAPGRNFDLAGAAGIVRRAVKAAHETLDERTVNDLAIGCAMLGDVVVIETLRDAGARFDAVRDQFGGTALHMAAKAGALPVMEALIEAGADVNACSADGSPPLHTIVLYTGADALREAIDLFARTGAAPRDLVNAADVFGETALHKVAACKSTDLVEKMEILCAAGADMNRTNAEGETPRGVLAFARKVLSAAGQDDLAAEIELLDQRMEAHGGRLVERPPKEARLPRVGFPLHAVIAAGQWDLIAKIQRFAPLPCLAAPDPYGRTPAMMLASADWSDPDGRGVPLFFDWLLARSGDLSASDASGRTVAHYACLATRHDRRRAAGIDTALQRLPPAVALSARDGLGRTPLHVAAAVGNTAGVRWLLERGEDAEATDELGNAPLHLAAQHGHWRAYDALSERPGQAEPGANAVGLTASAIRALKRQVFPDTADGANARAPVAGARRRRGLAARMLLWLLAVAAIAAAGAMWVLGPDVLLSLLPSR